jgi:hypothetical protein
MTSGMVGAVIAYFFVVPFVLVIVPLLLFLPVALVRSGFASTRWVEAVCRSPSEIRITWRTSRAYAASVVAQVACQLELGYGNLDPQPAERVGMTRPPGFEDRDR